MAKRQKHTHQGIDAFCRYLNNKTRTRVWKCSICGIEDVWKDTWQYYGAMGCNKCRIEPAIDAVTCSDQCRAKYDEQRERLMPQIGAR